MILVQPARIVTAPFRMIKTVRSVKTQSSQFFILNIRIIMVMKEC